MKWRPGDVLVLRHVERGRVFSAVATTVVEATPERVVLWVAPGNDRKIPAGRQQAWLRGWTPVDRPWHGRGVVIVKELAAAHSIWHFRGDDGDVAFWYGNLEDPARPSRFGLDSRDHVLDVLRPRDGGWRWKDEDEFAAAVGDGAFTEAEAAAIRAEGERVMRETRVPTGWEAWEPPPEWERRRLPEDWHVV